MARFAPRRRRAFVGAAALFGAVTVFVLVVFVVNVVADQQIRSGLFTYGLFTGAATIGLWRERRWGRGLALVVALGNAGLGTLSLLAVIIARDGPLLGPALLLGVSVVVAYALSRPVFSFPDEQ